MLFAQSPSRWVRLAAGISLAAVCVTGCSSDATPTGPDGGAIEAYLDEHPEAAARIDNEEDIEMDE